MPDRTPGSAMPSTVSSMSDPRAAVEGVAHGRQRGRPVVEPHVGGAPADGRRPGRKHQPGHLQAALDDGRPRAEREEHRRPIARRAAVHDEGLAVVDHGRDLEVVDARDAHALGRDRGTDAGRRPVRQCELLREPLALDVESRQRCGRATPGSTTRAGRRARAPPGSASSARGRRRSRPRPRGRRRSAGSIASPSGTNAANTENMMIAAAVTTRADPTKPSSTARTGSPWCTKSSRMRLTRNTS